ncbi:hypothetical protein PENFLA_c047G02975 [Penicillium flavigenum]|uniref:Uncharacterized protein n=1 Tax=Penicillium flavigenum TaxID=254877 RepID=A0A1V6SHY7_9EURO|nr:hypothetical protein PENFLA_c047G02975 [Penicillium flavigenum]
MTRAIAMEWTRQNKMEKPPKQEDSKNHKSQHCKIGPSFGVIDKRIPLHRLGHKQMRGHLHVATHSRH